MIQLEATPSSTAADVPSRPVEKRGSFPEYLSLNPFTGQTYVLVPRDDDEDGVESARLMAEGYEEQAAEAAWFAEATLSAQLAALPEDEAEE